MASITPTYFYTILKSHAHLIFRTQIRSLYCVINYLISIVTSKVKNLIYERNFLEIGEICKNLGNDSEKMEMRELARKLDERRNEKFGGPLEK